MTGIGEENSLASNQGQAESMHAAMRTLFPICRSITGEGVRKTLAWLSERVPLEVTETPSGSRVFDWSVPAEWNIRGAHIHSPRGQKIVDFADSNLHVVSYSQPISTTLDLDSLQPHLHSLPHRPDWIPYRTSYYQPSWGFCLPDRQRLALEPGEYRVQIDAEHDLRGSLTTGEVFLPGSSSDEVWLSCHICHPSLANDNLSSLVVAWKLIEYIAQQPRRYSYRFVFVPGTIGAITWLANNRALWPRVKAGLVLALLGDSAPLTYKRSRAGKSRIDTIAEYVLAQRGRYNVSDYTPIGYDERQYGSPGVNLPIGRLSRSIEGGYPEYHTSADNLDLVAPEQLCDSLAALQDIVECLEQDRVFSNKMPLGEPQLGVRGLYDTPQAAAEDPSALRSRQEALLWTQNLTDGQRGLAEIAQISGKSMGQISEASARLSAAGLLQEITPAAAAHAESSVPQAVASSVTSTETSAETSERSGQPVRQRAAKLIPGGCHTYSKGDDQYPLNAPDCFVSGSGCIVVDPQGREYIEYGMGGRSVGLGHAFPSVIAAAAKQMSLGANFTRPAAIELEAAEMLLSLLPAADMVKFAKNGSDATTAAVRLARAYTGRTKIAICADQPFFSVDDWFIAQTPMAAGIPADVSQQNLSFRYNDIDDLQQVLRANRGEVACLIMEAATYTEPSPGYLQQVQALCRQEGIVFVLDEMITGFRWHNGGAQAEYGVEPDLSTFGKALGNGFAVAALAGRKEIMQLGGLEHTHPRVFLLSYTHGAETHGLAAALETMRVYRDQPVVKTLYQQGAKLRRGLEDIAAQLGISDHFQLLGRDCNLIYVTKNTDGQRCQVMRTLLLQELIRRGIMAPSLVVGYTHTDAAIRQTLAAFEAALGVYREALERGPENYLHGRPSQPVFRKYN